jgi:hypothetical protein
MNATDFRHFMKRRLGSRMWLGFVVICTSIAMVSVLDDRSREPESDVKRTLHVKPQSDPNGPGNTEFDRLITPSARF